MSIFPSDETFGRYINQIGNATIDQINAAKAVQAQKAKQGILISLGEALVLQGVLTAAMKENVEKKLQAVQQGGIQKLGDFRLLKKLGEGGMGTVYLAEDTLAQRRVALKVLPKKFASDGDFLMRFRREAQAAGKLNHVNIVGAYALGEELGNHFYVMEFCEGESMDQRLKRERVLSWRHAVEVIRQAARGLKFAHERGFIHRDIKPANIFLTKEGIAKIFDLGLSKNIMEGDQSFNTQTGVTLGTPHYISPEQARGEKTVDGRTDIYSLGATLYHLITGETPFQASTAAAVMMKHITEQLPNPQDFRDDIPDGVVQVIQKMMAKDARDRHTTCTELLQDLDLVADGKPLSKVAIEVEKSTVAQRSKGTGARTPALRANQWREGRGTLEESGNKIILVVGFGVAALGLAMLFYSLYIVARKDSAHGKPHGEPSAPAASAASREVPIKP